MTLLALAGHKDTAGHYRCGDGGPPWKGELPGTDPKFRHIVEEPDRRSIPFGS
jgi:hypothetical protein